MSIDLILGKLLAAFNERLLSFTNSIQRMNKIVTLLIVVFAAIGFSLLLTSFLRLAWNLVIPELGGPKLNLWQTYALMWVVSILGKAWRN